MFQSITLDPSFFFHENYKHNDVTPWGEMRDLEFNKLIQGAARPATNTNLEGP